MAQKHTVMLVGEAFTESDERAGKPFSGPAGGILRGLLNQVGLSSDECYYTTVFHLRPPGNKVDRLCGPKGEGLPGYRALTQGKYVHKEYEPELVRLFREIDRINPNIIVALGNTALWALCKKVGIKKYRGAPLLTHTGTHKVIPTWAPSSIIEQWELRVISLADFHKIKRESAFPEIRRPSRLIYMEPNVEDIWRFYEEHLKHQPFISCDIETKNKTITEVGYGTADGRHAIVIPFWSRHKIDGNYWRTFEEEKEAWRIVRYINTTHPLIGQNFNYDMMYFWKTMGIPSPFFAGDTMILHHSLQPELEKGLGFLGSIYTDEPSWKFMRQDHATLKQEDE